MKKAVTGFTALVATALVLAASPTAAIGPSFFQNYVSGGAVVVRTANPFGTKLLAVNFRPADFSPDEANAAYLAILASVAGITIVDSFGPADLAVLGASPVQLVQALQQALQVPFGAYDKLFILDVYRHPPSVIGIDVYRWFGPDDFRYIITLQI